mgnify:CR=1 FL=1
MGKERYSILFSSMTGNTKELADAIREILPEETLDYFGLCKDADPQSEILYIGFWTDKGTADEATTTLLKSLRNLLIRNSRLWWKRRVLSESTSQRT